jgi:hypothetical protein
MIRISSRAILVIGFIMVLLGFVLPFLMVLKVLESTYFLNFFSYTVSLLGIFLGLMGSARMAAEFRSKRDE